MMEFDELFIFNHDFVIKNGRKWRFDTDTPLVDEVGQNQSDNLYKVEYRRFIKSQWIYNETS